MLSQRKTRLSNHLLFKDDDDGSNKDFKIEAATRRKTTNVEESYVVSEKQIQFIKTTT